MSSLEVFEHSIIIKASATIVENCFSDLELMHRWLNPVLSCDPIGTWSTTIGSLSRFRIKIPFWQPSLKSVVVEREPGLIVWQFNGFFQGRDRWECQPTSQGTILVNRFEFKVPNPIVSWGFRTFAESWTKRDMQAQLRRLKQVAEAEYRRSGIV